MKRPWDELSTEYQREQKISCQTVHYGPNGLDDSSLSLLGDVRGKRVLDLGCGGGQNSIALARNGALVTAVDNSANQLAYAKSLASKFEVEIAFICGEITNYKLWEGEYDFIISVFALEYIENLMPVISKSADCLMKGGAFIYCDLHPFVSSANVVGASTKSLTETMSYFDENDIQFNWTLQNVTVTLVRYHRTISTVVNMFVDAGFLVQRIHEPRIETDKHSCAYLDDSISAQSEAWNAYPYTLIVHFVKGEKN